MSLMMSFLFMCSHSLEEKGMESQQNSGSWAYPAVYQQQPTVRSLYRCAITAVTTRSQHSALACNRSQEGPQSYISDQEVEVMISVSRSLDLEFQPQQQVPASPSRGRACSLLPIPRGCYSHITGNASIRVNDTLQLKSPITSTISSTSMAAL